jgi:hypothetical protein
LTYKTKESKRNAETIEQFCKAVPTRAGILALKNDKEKIGFEKQADINLDQR